MLKKKHLFASQREMFIIKLSTVLSVLIIGILLIVTVQVKAKSSRLPEQYIPLVSLTEEVSYNTAVGEDDRPLSQAPQDLTIEGPETVSINQSYTFTATVSPSDATTPFTYTWKTSDDGAKVIHTGGDTSDVASLEWDTPGTQVLTVTATNGIDSVVASHTISVAIPVTSLRIQGLQTVAVDTPIQLTAMAEPREASLPMTFTWHQGDGTSDIVNTNNIVSDTVSFSWDTPGTKVITITATNLDQNNAKIYGLGEVAIIHIVKVTEAVQAYLQTYIPVITKAKPQTIFGIETSPGRIATSTVLEKAKALNPTWLRIKTVNWRDVQPQQGGAFDWSALETFEKELEAANQAHLTPIAIVHLNPDWATIPYQDSTTGETKHAPCGAVDAQYFDEFAAFMEALVSRYSQVTYWEIGNEPDVDPRLQADDQQFHFGCWGNIDDPYYGGKHYGEMLKVVAPAIRRANASAKIVIGGLLIDSPQTNDPALGTPERFFEGILEAGAAESFDIVGFHAYPWFLFGEGSLQDADIDHAEWGSQGGVTNGKIAFLRSTLAQYGVEKSLFLTEAAMLYFWDPSKPTLPDDQISNNFLQAQADHIVRQLTRSLAAGVEAYSWYTLHRSGWNYSGMLNGDGSPRPVYTAYQKFVEMIGAANNPTQLTEYGDVVYAYRFNKGSTVVDVVWAKGKDSQFVDVPTAMFQAAYTRDGGAVQVFDTGEQQKVETTLSPIYIVRSAQ